MKLFLVGLILPLLFNQAGAQALGKFNYQLRIEDYSSAEATALKQIEMLSEEQSNYKYLKKVLPYYYGLGKIYKNLGDYKKAESVIQKGREIVLSRPSKKGTKKLGRADLDLSDALADIQLEIGNYKLAAELLDQSFEERRETMRPRDLERYRPYLYMAKYLIKIGKPQVALSYLQDYILNLRNTYKLTDSEIPFMADAYELLAKLYLDKGELDEAIRFSKLNIRYQKHSWVKSRVGKNNLNQIESLNLLARCYLKKDTTLASATINQAFSMYEKTVGRPSIYKVPLRLTKAELHWIKGDYYEAFQNFKEANALQLSFANENLGRLSEYEKENLTKDLYENSQLFYLFTVEALAQNVPFKNDLLHEAYKLRLNSKAKILDETSRLKILIDRNPDSHVKIEFENWKTLKNEYARMISTGGVKPDRISEVELKINQVERSLNESVSLSYQIGHLYTPFEVSRVLSENEAAIEIIRVESMAKSKDIAGYLILTLKRNDSIPIHSWMNNAKMLEGSAFSFYSNTKRFLLDDTVSFKHYFKSITNLTKGKDKIYISPDGIYSLINLSILQNNEQYVSDTYKIINVSNTKNIKKAQPLKAITTASLFGRPQYDHDIPVPELKEYKKDTVKNRAIINLRGEISDLPGTELEVIAISDMLRKSGIDVKMFLHEGASESTLKEITSTDILHIATHGFFNSKGKYEFNPLFQSGILMSGIKGSRAHDFEDGILTAYEASLLNLSNTKLVVLSACETGLGEIRSGEGVYGLQRSFEAAGVTNILISLWKVDDDATMLLMKSFYEALVKSKNVGNSFDEAQIKLRAKYKHPYYWGAFKLIGE